MGTSSWARDTAQETSAVYSMHFPPVWIFINLQSSHYLTIVSACTYGCDMIAPLRARVVTAAT